MTQLHQPTRFKRTFTRSVEIGVTAPHVHQAKHITNLNPTHGQPNHAQSKSNNVHRTDTASCLSKANINCHMSQYKDIRSFCSSSAKPIYHANTLHLLGWVAFFTRGSPSLAASLKSLQARKPLTMTPHFADRAVKSSNLRICHL